MRITNPVRFNPSPLRRTPTSSPSANPVGGLEPAVLFSSQGERSSFAVGRDHARRLSAWRCSIWFAGSSNPFTPAGYVGYLTKGAVLGQSRFYGVQRGPTSPGRTWLLQVTNVSITPYTYSEDFAGDEAVLSRDNLKIAFRVHTVWRIDDARVPLFMDRFSTTVTRDTIENATRTRSSRSPTAHFVREPLRTFARDEVQRRNGLEVKEALIPIGDAVLARIRQYADEHARSSSPASSSATSSIRPRSPMRCRASWRRRRSCSGRTPRSRSNARSGRSARSRRRASPTRCRSSAAS